MPIAEFMALLALGTVTSFTPGPNTTLSTALAANRGFKGALHFVVAVPVGWGLLFGLCAFGLGAMVSQVPLAAALVKYGGIAYLLWLASKLWKSGALTQVADARLDVSFAQGVMLQFLNIKAWMLALSVVGGWLAGRADFVPRLWITLPVMLTFAFVSNLSYALVGSLLRAWLAQGRRLLWFNRGMAMVLVLTCVWLLTYTVPMSPSHASSSSSFALLLSSTSKAPV